MEDINKKIEEFENKYGMCELSVDDLENVGGGAGIGLNSQDSVGSFCEIVNVLFITQGIDEAVKFASKFVSGQKVQELLQNGGVNALNTYLTEQVTGRITGAIPKPGKPV